METHKVNDWQFGEMEWDEGQKAYVTSLKWSNDKKVTLYLYCERDCFHCVLETNRMIFNYLRENEKKLIEKEADNLVELFKGDPEEPDEEYLIHEKSDLIEALDLEYVELDFADTSRIIYSVEFIDGLISYIKLEVTLKPFYNGFERDCMP
jgi:hypothetical protein